MSRLSNLEETTVRMIAQLQRRIEKLELNCMPIVRCKECKHNPAQEDNCPLPAQYIVPKGYCHLGEEKNVCNKK